MWRGKFAGMRQHHIPVIVRLDQLEIEENRLKSLASFGASQSLGGGTVGLSNRPRVSRSNAGTNRCRSEEWRGEALSLRKGWCISTSRYEPDFTRDAARERTRWTYPNGRAN